MTASLPIPAPTVTVETRPFWDALAESRFVLPQCERCTAWIWYPRGFCPKCGSTDIGWHEASGRGRVYSYTVVRKSGLPGWGEVVPYVIAYIELDEGPRVMTNIVDCEPDAVKIGSLVRVAIAADGDGNALFRFRLDGDAPTQ
ncbi:MAG: Zn-ribbon domain-containing OB-fold protein [Actinomycetota bacterium]